jgi:hypothetical protein
MELVFFLNWKNDLAKYDMHNLHLSLVHGTPYYAEPPIPQNSQKILGLLPTPGSFKKRLENKKYPFPIGY